MTETITLVYIGVVLGSGLTLGALATTIAINGAVTLYEKIKTKVGN